MIAGVATAGISHGALVADALKLPFVYVRSKAKGHGLQNLIEGEVKGGEEVVVVEDLISTGGSSLKAVEALKEAGCKVNGVVAIFSYGFDDAEREFNNAGLPMYTLSDYDHLLDEAIQKEYIPTSSLETLNSWRKNRHEWAQKV